RARRRSCRRARPRLGRRMAFGLARWLFGAFAYTLVAVGSVLLCISPAARADEPAEPAPPAAKESAAGDAGAPPSIEDEEAAVLRAPAPPRPPAPRAPAPSPPAARSAAPRPRARPAAVVAEPAPAVDAAPAFVIELDTAGFVSGALDGGLFVGGRLP